jgi:hypothetical protein
MRMRAATSRLIRLPTSVERTVTGPLNGATSFINVFRHYNLDLNKEDR